MVLTSLMSCGIIRSCFGAMFKFRAKHLSNQERKEVILMATEEIDDDRIVCESCPDAEICVNRESWIFQEQIAECENAEEPSFREDDEFIDEAIAEAISDDLEEI